MHLSHQPGNSTINLRSYIKPKTAKSKKNRHGKKTRNLG